MSNEIVKRKVSISAQQFRLQAKQLRRLAKEMQEIAKQMASLNLESLKTMGSKTYDRGRKNISRVIANANRDLHEYESNWGKHVAKKKIAIDESKYQG